MNPAPAFVRAASGAPKLPTSSPRKGYYGLEKNVSDSEPFSVRMTVPGLMLCRANQPSLTSKTYWMLSTTATTELVSFFSR